MKKNAAVFVITGLLGVAGSLSVAVSANAADEPQLVCEQWSSGTFYYKVEQTAARTFAVTLIDQRMAAAGPGGDGPFTPPSHYIPMPESIRMATNTIHLGSNVAIDAEPSLSQGVITTEGEGGAIEFGSLLRYPKNPAESVSVANAGITWLQDTDARIVDGHPIIPSLPPNKDIDESTGVLEMTVTFPGTAGGDFKIIDQIDIQSYGAKLDALSGEWFEDPIADIRATVPGCTVFLAEVPDDDAEVPDDDVDGDPVTPPTPEGDDIGPVPQTPDDSSKDADPLGSDEIPAPVVKVPARFVG